MHAGLRLGCAVQARARGQVHGEGTVVVVMIVGVCGRKCSRLASDCKRLTNSAGDVLGDGQERMMRPRDWANRFREMPGTDLQAVAVK